MARMIAVAVAVLCVAGLVSAQSPIVMRTYGDAFCNTVATETFYQEGKCAAMGDLFVKYSINDGVLSHCSYSSATCEGDALSCGRDASLAEAGKCAQNGQGASSMVDFQKVLGVHDMELAAASSSSSSTGRSPSPPAVEYVYSYYWYNSSVCTTKAGDPVRDTYKYRVGYCQSKSYTPTGNYEVITFEYPSSSSGRAKVCRYTDVNCYYQTGNCLYYNWDYCNYVNNKESYTYSQGDLEALLAGLAAFIIVLIVIGSLLVLCSILTFCCCGAWAAACFARMCCGLCGNRNTSTEYHVRLTA